MPGPQPRPPVARRVAGLAARIGTPAFVAACTALMGGAPREEYVEELRGLTGRAWAAGDPAFDRTTWRDYWVRTWGARGLLHVWDDDATVAVVAGLADEHWRPAEMCLKVAARHEVAGTADGAALLAGHELPRVRSQALRALAVVGDTEHVSVVESALDDVDVGVRGRAELARSALVRRLDL